MSKKRRKAKGKRARKRRIETPRVRLSLCMIARDEAAFLERCLASVEGLVDEVVVVDTGSTDDTVEVAKGRGARVFSETWQDDFSQARNRSVERARGEWILSLDCDELLNPGDCERLLSLLERGDADAYRMTTRNYTEESNQAGWVACGGEYVEEKQYAGWFPTTKVRLWRNRPEFRFEGVVHELVEPAILRAEGRIADCPVPVHHYGYVEKERSPDQYLRAGERKVAENPDDLRARYELAVAYRNAGRLEKALVCIEGVAEEFGEEGKRLYVQEEFVLLVRADLLNRLGKREEALAAYGELLERFPDSYQALNNRGLILERMGRCQEALNSYEKGLRIAPDNRVLADNLERLRAEGGVRRLSVCVIARDEEGVLGRCLESVAGLADEVVVVDTGSTDRTVEIAREYGAQVGFFDWCDDFAAARNASLEMATGDWILWLDADDYLPPADRQKVENAKRMQPDQAFYFRLVNEGADRSTFRQIKMFPNRPEIRFERPVHETVLPSLEKLGIPLRSTDVEVRHTGYADPEVTARKQRFYLELMRRWLERHPDDFQTCFRIGYTFYAEGDRERADEFFDVILAAGADRVRPLSILRFATTFKGRCALEEGRLAEAGELLEEARRLEPEDALALACLGDVRARQGAHAEAVDLLAAAREGKLDPNFPLEKEVFYYSLNFSLGQSHLQLGRREEAIRAFEAARQIQPERVDAVRELERLQGGRSAAPGLRLDQITVEADAHIARRNRLSLCMIVRNEEARLGRCLESARDVADEIVVVDTGSTDGTVAVAERYGARIGHFAWCDDFSAARNVSLGMATGDWIMWLDADDILPAEEHAKIRHLVEQGKEKCYFFLLDDQGYESVSCLQMRLFPNLSGVCFEMPIHEQVSPSLTRLGLQMVSTDIRVRHTGYTTPEVVGEKKERYLRIMERWLEDHPENYIVRSHVALTYHTTGRLEEAAEAYRKIVEESSCLAEHNYVVYTTSLLFLGRTYLKMGELEKAREYMNQAREYDPDYVLTLVSLGEVHIRLEEFAVALDFARSVIAGKPQATFFPVDYDEVLYSAHLICGQAHQGLGEFVEAEEAYRRAAAIPAARRSEALGKLSNMLKEQGARERALAVLREALELDGDNAQHLFNIGVMHLEARELERAEEVFRQVLGIDPKFASALLNLGYIAKIRGELQAAEGFYRQAAELEEEGVEAHANLGHLLLDQECFDEAGEMFATVCERTPGLLDVELGLMVVRARQQRVESALALLGDLLPRFPEVGYRREELQGALPASRLLVRLGAVLVGRKLLRCAEFALMAAVAFDGGFADGRRALAEVLMAEGEHWKAVAQFEAILQGQPEDGSTFQRLGDCYRKLGVEEAAQMCYAQSLRLAGGNGE